MLGENDSRRLRTCMNEKGFDSGIITSNNSEQDNHVTYANEKGFVKVPLSSESRSEMTGYAADTRHKMTIALGIQCLQAPYPSPNLRFGHNDSVKMI